MSEVEVGDAVIEGDLSQPDLAAADWEPPEPTGIAVVDDAVGPLVGLADLPTAEHVAHYEAAHRRLQDALADLDTV